MDFIKIVFKNSMKKNMENVIVVFDKGKKTFRSTHFEEYKGNRKPMPDDLFNQSIMVREFLDSINVLSLERSNYEADDLAGSLIKYFSKNEIFFLTSDKDFLQLIKKNVKVLLITKSGTSNIQEYNIENFESLFNLKLPKQIIDFKILSGDKSDNIPKIEKN